ncbi:hypothetical protein FB564_3241 [Salinispora arenicola]|uniref:Uncharacterized protein n=1 Tax=Salinispora arenicola TaxID=168697 RepID=A0A542XQE7_SALAC|nr:hypothetical protein FB564_3241 [Salinispora arenicola]
MHLSQLAFHSIDAHGEWWRCQCSAIGHVGREMQGAEVAA